ncbi:MAG: MipA/OmpV family protein [Sphingobium sp.]
MIYRTRSALAAFALVSLSLSTSALAQDEPVKEPTIFDGDFLTVGVAGAITPSYEGSDDYIVTPAPAVAGRIAGIGITPRVGGLALDFINDPDDAKVKMQLGPVVRLRLDRTRQIKDEVVARLGKLDTAVEVGANAGFSISGITNPYDSLTFSVDMRWDVAGAHRGEVIAPNATFQTPLSKASYAVLNISAEHVDDNYADYYFSVTPAGSAASGLRPYQAQGGWKNISAGLIGALDLDGDLTNGGWAIFAAGNYSRVLGNFERSPIVADRGSANQWTGAIGIGYTF